MTPNSFKQSLWGLFSFPIRLIIACLCLIIALPGFIWRFIGEHAEIAGRALTDLALDWLHETAIVFQPKSYNQVRDLIRENRVLKERIEVYKENKIS